MPCRPYNTIEKFWSKPIRGEDGCWRWPTAVAREFYGTYRLDRTVWHCHRLAWFLTHGRIPKGKIVRHLCGNRECCNPAHLALGSQKDNTDDTLKQGRRPFGEAHHRAIFTEDQVREIRRLYGPGKRAGGVGQDELAERYGTSQTQISRIVLRKQWPHVK